MQTVAETMKEELEVHREKGCSNTLYDDALRYTATMCCSLMDKHNFTAKVWDSCFTPYIGPFVGDHAKEACQCASPALFRLPLFRWSCFFVLLSFFQALYLLCVQPLRGVCDF